MEFHIRAKMQRKRSECRDGAHADEYTKKLAWRRARLWREPPIDRPTQQYTHTQSPNHPSTSRPNISSSGEQSPFVFSLIGSHVTPNTHFLLRSASLRQGHESCALLMRLLLIWLVCVGLLHYRFLLHFDTKIGSRKSDVLENCKGKNDKKICNFLNFIQGAE